MRFSELDLVVHPLTRWQTIARVVHTFRKFPFDVFIAKFFLQLTNVRQIVILKFFFIWFLHLTFFVTHIWSRMVCSRIVSQWAQLNIPVGSYASCSNESIRALSHSASSSCVLMNQEKSKFCVCANLFFMNIIFVLLFRWQTDEGVVDRVQLGCDQKHVRLIQRYSVRLLRSIRVLERVVKDHFEAVVEIFSPSLVPQRSFKQMHVESKISVPCV